MNSRRLIAGLTMTWMFCIAPPSEARSPDELRKEAAAIQAQIDKAKQIAASGDFAGAADLFAEIAAEHPKDTKGQRAAVLAGQHYCYASDMDKAIEQFDLAHRLGVNQDISELALFEKARLCRKSGRTEDARSAVHCLRIAYPESQHLLPALEIKGELERTPADEVSRILHRERQARELVISARAKLATSTGRAELPALIDEIERDYADTSAAISILPIKGELLHIRRRFEEAQAIWQQLHDRIVPVAPHSNLAAQAKRQIREEMLREAVYLCERAVATPGTKDAAMVQLARMKCSRVLEMPAPDNGALYARARAMLVELEIFDDNYERAETLAERFLSSYYSGKRVINGQTRHVDLRRLPDRVLFLHLSVAQAARSQRKYTKALAKCEEVKTLFAELPQEDQLKLQRLLKRAHLEAFLALVESGADRHLAQAAGDELLTRFSDPRTDNLVRRRLGLGNK